MSQEEIVDALLAFIGRNGAGDDEFEALALRLFAYQFKHNAPYRRFAQQRGRTPLTVRRWRDIPAVPIKAFKDLTLSCRPPDEAVRVFMTSGTTGSGRGRSYHPTLAVYDASMLAGFAARIMRGREAIRMGILFPDEAALPNSSLAHYLALAAERFGTPASAVFVGPAGLDLPALLAALGEAEASGAPYALLGATYAFVPVLDALREQGRRFALPPGSFLFETGGFKGQSREIEPEAFYDGLSEAFGVPRESCLNMYGMTELSTQFYDDGNAVCPPVKSGPHWIRSRVVDPLTGADLPEGEPGVLVHHDLAHFNSVSAILTEDAGVIVPGGFRLLGRVEGSASRGCSVAVAEFLAAAQG
ncbi:long-chain fatty acid--CoA ligase [Methylobacterium platani]|uniref:Long-chain fatty acid--CoA ligase n=1 Tax=Methylobacterium platani TaxID=427683 RepID=A0A179SIK5_9HYPH|nr:long-chain fatty acid--CoA ligase [Methylobacterium platani]OAS26394.1 long-chain fatty acid--CoA ligase [Methylobacterium platani]